MADHDRFELDLARALRSYAESAPTEVRPTELARQFATAYPRRRTMVGPWRPLALSRAAWFPLLLATLLTALVAGMLVVGSQPERTLPAVTPTFACPPGSAPDEPGRIDQARPPDIHPGSPMAFDRRARRLIALAGADAGPATVFETWTFDVCTNTWTQMHPDLEPPAQVGGLVYDVDSDLTIGVHSEDWLDAPVTGTVWAYDLEADTWTEKGPAKGQPVLYDPVSGLVVAGSFESTDLWDYDVETDTWTSIRQTNAPGSSGVMAYDASVDRAVMLTGGGGAPETWLLDLRTGTWSRSGAEAPVFITGWWAVPAVAYDESAERSVFLGNARWAAYDAAADRWEGVLEPGPSLPRPTVYDAVNQRLVGWRLGGDVIEGDVVAYDLATRDWTVLLAADDGQPAPSPE